MDDFINQVSQGMDAGNEEIAPGFSSVELKGWWSAFGEVWKKLNGQ